MRRTIFRFLSSFHSSRAERELAREIRSHLQLLEDQYIARGMDAEEARYAALRAFGGVEQVKEHQREARMFRWLAGWPMDLKLGCRMLVKYPGLTIVGGLAMAFAICVGIVIFQVLSLFVHPSLPLSQGDRLVQIRNWDVSTNSAEQRALYDFNVWRTTLRSVTELGAWRDVARNLIVTDGEARPVQVAEITPSAFRVADGTPLMGRVLMEADERLAAPPVAVIGYDVWRTRFGSDPAVVGRSAQLGAEHVTIVGVMREGFAFPIAHEVWTPLRVVNDAHPPRSGPAISVFGLLAHGATLEKAQAELTTAGRTAALEDPATHQHLQPRVSPYAAMFFSQPSGEDLAILFSIFVFAIMLLVLVCSNVALLMFARAASRESELTMRTALGASRGRIVAQMFAEALVLGGVSALVGLVAARAALKVWGVDFLEANLGRLPFWFDLSLSPGGVGFAIALTMLGSAVAGVMPALKVTRRMGLRLKHASAGCGGLQFGGVWTAVIVAQVAVTVAFPVIVYVEQWQLRHVESFDTGFAVGQYLAVRIDKDAPGVQDVDGDRSRDARRAALASTLEALRERVVALPGAGGVTFTDQIPGTPHPECRIQLDGDTTSNGPTPASDLRLALRVVSVAAIEPSYFDVLGTPIRAGRAFNAADLTPDAHVAIVDQGFADQVTEGRNPVGRRVRFRNRDAEPGPWIEIVGIVKELGMGAPIQRGRAAGLYVPAAPDGLPRIHMMVHASGDPMLLAPQLREIAAAVDPTLRLSDLQRLDEVTDVLAWVIRLWLRITVMMTAVALLLSLAGIYAVLSFIVARRTREIGIRVALGATRRRVVVAVFRRPLTQVALGVLVGGALIALAGTVETEMPGLSGDLSIRQIGILIAYAALMLGVCLLACVVPTRRALSVEPTVALRMD